MAEMAELEVKVRVMDDQEIRAAALQAAASVLSASFDPSAHALWTLTAQFEDFIRSGNRANIVLSPPEPEAGEEPAPEPRTAEQVVEEAQGYRGNRRAEREARRRAEAEAMTRMEG